MNVKLSSELGALSHVIPEVSGGVNSGKPFAGLQYVLLFDQTVGQP